MKVDDGCSRKVKLGQVTRAVGGEHSGISFGVISDILLT